MSTSPIGFAIVGYGRIGHRHAALIGERQDTRLCAVADKQGAGPGGIPFFRSMEEMLNAPVSGMIDVVCIATPNGCHAAQACAALEAGKHVVVEKPLALTVKEAERIMTTAERAGRRAFTVMQNRYSAAARWLKTILEAKGLGAVYMIQVNAFWNRDQRYYLPGSWHGTPDMDGGVLYTQFSHMVDMIYWLAGELRNIQTRLGNFAHHAPAGFADSGSVLFDLRDGGIGGFHFSTAVWNKNLENSLTVIGEKGTVRITGQYMDHIGYCDLKDVFPVPDPQTDDPMDNHRRFFTDVVDVLKGEDRPAVENRDAVRVVDIIERIYKNSI